MKQIGSTFLLIFISTISLATTWREAYPYTQQIEGQDIVVKAYSYSPYRGSPMPGVTKVYRKNKLLYTIDKYYREKIFTSADGKYLVVVNTSNGLGVTSYTSFGNSYIDFDFPAIEIYDNGKRVKDIALRKVVDTAMLASNGRYFYWGYHFNYPAFENATSNCTYWSQDLSKKEKKECLNGDTTSYCREWIVGCDSAKIFKRECFILDNSIYLIENVLHILTDQNKVVTLDFSTLNIQKLAFEKIVPDKKAFKPPQFNRKYHKVKLPEKFAQPRLKNKDLIEDAAVKLFNLSLCNTSEKERYSIFIDFLLIDKYGKCTEFYGKVYDNSISKNYSEKSINKEMTEKLKKWAMEQTYETKLIPNGFEAYGFLCIFDLK